MMLITQSYCGFYSRVFSFIEMICHIAPFGCRGFRLWPKYHASHKILEVLSWSNGTLHVTKDLFVLNIGIRHHLNCFCPLEKKRKITRHVRKISQGCLAKANRTAKHCGLWRVWCKPKDQLNFVATQAKERHIEFNLWCRASHPEGCQLWKLKVRSEVVAYHSAHGSDPTNK